MKKSWLTCFVLMLATVASTTAQPILDEQHYLVYDLPDPATFVENVILADQFGEFTANQFTLAFFANPVEKRLPDGTIAGPILDDRAHLTWWEFFNPQPDERLVGIDNQFGRQDLIVRDGLFLLLPAGKDSPDIPLRNHYECYDAEGPDLFVPVTLVDQFGSFNVEIRRPELFCNPVVKTRANGEVSPIVDVESHLTCYRIEPPFSVTTGHNGFDQFGTWNIRPVHTTWLCVPTFKLTVVSTQSRSWGQIKALYDN